MQHVPDAPWIGRGLPEQSPIETELCDELDALTASMREADRLLARTDESDVAKVASLELLMTQMQERIEEIERDLRSIRYSL
jgi:hypothetical protein